MMVAHKQLNKFPNQSPGAQLVGADEVQVGVFGAAGVAGTTVVLAGLTVVFVVFVVVVVVVVAGLVDILLIYYK